MKGQFRVNGGSFKPITHIGLTRESILQVSRDVFDDDDPCIIHETNCRQRISLDLMELIKTQFPDMVGAVVKIGDLDPQIRKVLAYEDDETIEFK